MGACCSAHLVDMVSNYMEQSGNRMVFVVRFKGDESVTCDYCGAPAEFVVSYS